MLNSRLLSVCVIDEDEQDYRPILDALNGLYVSCVHILGNDIDKLPLQPFRRLRLVFLDLHLTAAVGKGAASHTANVFLRVVARDTAPIVVVIWSKYAHDRVVDPDVPPEDQDTEAELFKRTLLQAEPQYNGRVIFVEMEKPKRDARPEDWTEALKGEIESVLSDQSAIEVLWIWDSLVKNASAAVGEELTSLAAESAAELKDGLKETMQRLTRAQGESDLSPGRAPDHLVAVLGELLTDQLEHMEGLDALSRHGAWLNQKPAAAPSNVFAALMNGILMTAGPSEGTTPFAPGTLYRLQNTLGSVLGISDPFHLTFGRELASLVDLCCDKSPESPKLVEWRNAAKPVFLEVSPVCDVAQGNRVSALLIGGLIVPNALFKFAKSAGESFTRLPIFHLRWPAPDFPEQDAFLVFCHRYKAVISASQLPEWLEPWFRLRELPTASLRNLQAAHAARVGFVSLGS